MLDQYVYLILILAAYLECMYVLCAMYMYIYHDELLSFFTTLNLGLVVIVCTNF